MTKRTLVSLMALLSLLAPASFGEDEQSSPVDTLMEQMSRDMKKLSRQVDNPAARERSLSLADGLIEASNKAKALVPESAGERSGQELNDYLSLYQRGLDALLEQFKTLKQAIEADDSAAAEAALEEAWSLREHYHRELRLNS